MAKTYAQHCGLARALDRIGERWTLLIVRQLLLGPARYTDLRAALPGMATNLLAERLRTLEEEGILARRRLPPPAAATTVYELTELGRGLDEVVTALIRWGGHWMRERAETDALRPEWLALAVRALTAAGPDLSCVLDIEGHPFTLTLADGTVDISAGTSPAAGARLVTDPRSMLAVASGARPLTEAIETGAVEAHGDPATIAALTRLWHGEAQPAAPA